VSEYKSGGFDVGVRPHLKVMQSASAGARASDWAGGDWLTTNMVLRYQSDTIDFGTCGGADETGPFSV
jgi:hypothetical protein